MLAGITAAMVAAGAAVKNAERKILIENITQERAKWRDKVRTLAVDVHKAAVKGETAKLAELKLSFATSLNPESRVDNLILELIERLKDQKDQQSKLDELSDRISLLLKHDWQRAKKEANPKEEIKVKRLTLAELKSHRAAC